MSAAILETRGLKARYGDFQALYGIDTVVERGETIAIIGAKVPANPPISRPLPD